jgi:hypothetical protein
MIDSSAVIMVRPRFVLNRVAMELRFHFSLKSKSGVEVEEVVAHRKVKGLGASGTLLTG